MGLPENLDRAVYKIQRATMAANSLRVALIALNAASGPLGWALAGIGLAMSAFAIQDAFMEITSE